MAPARTHVHADAAAGEVARRSGGPDARAHHPAWRRDRRTVRGDVT